MLYLMVRGLARILFKIYFRVQIFGRENIPLTGRLILASNHVSFLDPPLLGAACPRIVSFLAKEELFRNRLFGWFLNQLNAFPLKPKASDLKALRWAVDELERERVIVIFPEGGRRHEPDLGKPLAGVGFLAANTGAPIVPVFVEGSQRAWPVRGKFIWPRKIRLYFGPAIRVKLEQRQQKNENYLQIAHQTMDGISKLKNNK